MTIKLLEPLPVWQYFHQLTQIPRPSHQEEAIQQYILNEACNLGLAAERDDAGNIIIRKPASAGREQEGGVILQGHLDMVAQKNQDTKHDFSTDPIRTQIDGDWVKADGTTLGADNGMGVAMILAILATENISHPPLEALFTSSEETGMIGAKALQSNVLQGKYLINLDYEDEGKLCIGCAGGIDGSFQMPFTTEKGDYAGYQLSVRGLRGGHSGVDIDKNRGNAIKILADILIRAQCQHIADLRGGGLRNAIPREADAIIALTPEQLADLQQKLPLWQETIRDKLAADDQGLQLDLTPACPLLEIIRPEDSATILQALRELPNGVIHMSLSMPNLVETSTNLAEIYCENNTFHIHCLLRSSHDSERDKLAAKMTAVIHSAGGNADYSGAYGGWQPQPTSELVNTLQTAGEKIYNTPPEITAIHAGLECGILSTHYPHWQMIAFGPTIESPHSPDERVHIPSVERSYHWLLAALEMPFS